MAENLIRTKQINQADLSGVVQNVISSNQYSISISGTGINVNTISAKTGYFNNFLQVENLSANNVVYNTGNQTISGEKTFINKVNISNLASIYPAASNFRRYIPDSVVTMGTAQPFTGFINYFPIILKKDAVNPNICVEATTLFGRDNTSVVVGIYTGAGFQGANLFYSGVINISASSTPTGISRLSTNITLTKGGYLLASVVTGAANPISFRSVSSNAFASFLGVNTGMGTFFDGITTTQSDWAPYESGVTINGTLPSTIGSGLWSRTIRSPLVCLEY